MNIALIAPSELFCDGSVVSEFKPLDDLVRLKLQQTRRYSPSDSLLQIAAATPRQHNLLHMDDQYQMVDPSVEVDIAALTVMTVNADRAYAIAASFRKRGVYVVMGGVHVTLCPEDAASHADTIITGDADIAWKAFLRDFQKKRPEKIYRGGAVDICVVPPPRISLLPREQFVRLRFQKEAYGLRTSVGCTRGCRFCSNCSKPGCQRLRKKTMRQIDLELRNIASSSDNYMIGLLDDNPFLDIAHITRVLERIKDLRVRWFGGADVSIAEHPRLLDLIRDSGNLAVVVGLESIDRQDLRWLAPWKSRRAGRYPEGICRMRDHGLSVMGSFLIGLDHDTPDSFQRYLDFFFETKMAEILLAVVTPYPGTPLREKFIREGRLDAHAPWSAYTGLNVLFRHPTMTKDQIYRGLHWFLSQLDRSEVREQVRGWQ